MRNRKGSVHPIVVARASVCQRAGTAGAARDDEAGFTLIELIVVVAIMPILVGAMTAALLSILSFTPTITNRLSDSGDAQVLSTYFNRDVQGATLITTDASSTSPAPCGTGTQLLGIQYGNGTEVSYSLVTQGTPATQNLLRNVCQTSGTGSTFTGSTVVSRNVVSQSGSGPPAAVITCSVPTAPACGGSPNASQGWAKVAQIESVTLPLTYASSSYKQTLLAAPSAGINASGGATLTTAPYSCGFATAGTGTYASTLCFMDFTAWNNWINSDTGTPCAGGGLQVTDGIAGTPFTMSFCLSTSGGPIVAAAIPTYTDPPTSEAFLGNNGFYTGIPGNPALYQNQEGTTSNVTISNIQVLGSNGVPATNWNLVTGDAESTDNGESQTWTAGWNAGSSIPANQQVFTLIDNSPTSAIGNACANPTAGTGLTPGNGLSGIGTNSVECQASVSSDKTGTVMISAPAPTSLTVNLVGTGLEAMFMGILLSS